MCAAILAALLFGGNAALADGHGRGDFYVGGGIASIQESDACPLDFSRNPIAAAAPSGRRIIDYPVPSQRFSTCEDKEHGVKAFAGVRATENFGAEFGYIAADGFGKSANIGIDSGPGSITEGLGPVDAKTDTRLFYLAGVGYYPVSDGFSLLGKAGVHQWEKEYTVNHDSSTDSLDLSNLKVKEDGVSIIAGIGGQYDFADLPISLRGEYEYARLDSSSSLRLLSFSVLWRF